MPNSKKNITTPAGISVKTMARAEARAAEVKANAEARAIARESKAKIAEALKAARAAAKLAEAEANRKIAVENSIEQKKLNAKREKCEYCEKKFLTKNLPEHICVVKRRWLDRDLRVPTLGYKLYITYHGLTFRHAQTPTYLSFAQKAGYYNAFCDFARYLMDIEALDTKEFIRFLYRLKIPMKQWKHPIVYQEFLLHQSKNESSDRAVQRTMNLMKEWSIETGEPWNDFFRKVATPRATLWIKLGRISPWVLLTTDSGRSLLDRLSDEQRSIMEKSIDFEFWGRKLEENAEAVGLIAAVWEEEGL